MKHNKNTPKVFPMKIDSIVRLFNEKDESVTIAAFTPDGQLLRLDEVYNAAADNSLISWRLQGLTGKILTIVDAAIADKEQKKAIKDLIRQSMSLEFEYFSDTLQKGYIDEFMSNIAKMSGEEFDKMVAENPPVSLDEIIAPGK